MTEASPRRGWFLTFEGLDGSGKTTQMHLLAGRLRSLGYEVVETVEPGGTAIGAQIRRILLDAANHAMAPTTELLLYFASRAQNVEECIRPALEQGRIVISDRFTDSTVVYQGLARGLGEEVVAELHRIACGGLRPDLTIYIDIDPHPGLARARRRNQTLDGDQAVQTRMDEQSIEFYRKVRRGYQTLAAREPNRFLVVDGRRDIDAVAADVWAGVQAALSDARV